jgi:putative hemolysin
VRLLSASTELVLRLLGVQPSSEPSVTEEEVKIMLEHGTRVGVFEPIEEEMVGRVFRLGDRSVSTLITPRPQVTWLDVEDSQEQIEQKIMNSPYGHFPVAKGDLDNLLGVVHIKDLLAHVMEGKRIHLRELATDPLFVPEGMRAFDMLERFRETRSQIALVVDEYGSLEGLITLMDILEALVGDIPDPHEPEEADVIERDDGSWLVDGKVPLDELQFLVDIDTWPMEGDQFYQTLGGFVMTQLGRIPTSSDHFEWQRFRFEVVDMDGRRVDKVLIRQLSEPTETPVTDQEDAD